MAKSQYVRIHSADWSLVEILCTVTEADTLEELRRNVREAVECHFDEGTAPKLIRLHIVRDEVLAV